MNSLRHPVWLLVCVILPLSLMEGILSHLYGIIGVDLDSTSRLAWQVALAVVAAWMVANAAIASVFWIRQRPLPLWVGALAAVLGVAALVATVWGSDVLVPRSVPRWVASDDDILRYGFTFVMPVVVWGLYLLASARAQARSAVQSRRDLVAEMGGVFLLPSGVFFLFTVASPMFSLSPNVPVFTLFVAGFTACTTLFAYCLVALVRRGSQRPIRQGGGLDWTLRIAALVVAPLGGLALNQALDCLFGDFSHPMWFALAAVGGVAYLVPLPSGSRWNLLQFWVRCATAPYFAYFFLLFLPFLPLSLLALLLVGFGFLMLSPLVAGVFVANLLGRQWKSLRAGPQRGWVPWIGLAGMVLLPGWVVVDALWTRIQIRTVMAYAYDAPGHPLDLASVDLESLADGIAQLESRFGGHDSRAGTREGEQLYLSEFRDWAIFDNLMVAPARLAAMKALFAPPEDSLAEPSDAPAGRDVGGVAANGDSTLVRLAKVQPRREGESRTWLDLDLVRPRRPQDSGQTWRRAQAAEFRAKVRLPRDVFVDGYTLKVGDSLHQGVLAERRTAEWVYTQITRTNRDPGLLRYLQGGSDLELRVFPFAEAERRHTSIRFLHRRPVQIRVGDSAVALGGADQSGIVEFPGLGMVVPEPALAGLPRRIPPVRIHFVLDASRAAGPHRNVLAASLESFLQRSGLDPASVRILSMNVRGTDLSEDPEWSRRYRQGPFEGGFFLERAVKHVLSDKFQRGSDTVPMVVAVSDRTDFVFLESDLDLFASVSPGVHGFFRLDRRGVLERFPFSGEGPVPVYGMFIPDSVGELKDRKGRNHWVDLREGSVLVPFPDSVQAPLAGANLGPWERAAANALRETRLAVLARDGDRAWKEILGESFASGVLARATAYLALETATQENALRAKQQEVLEGDRNMDLDTDESVRMSEPGPWILLVLAGMVWIHRRGRRRLSRS
ncbi:MAG TPA: MSEP-CTERM sorting domain-containing protein [Fibrobacteria bacterium]|nr:MSEP-CTERM sorting domain-containing protein [Fibrobacteria bacterium]HOX51872.1 MSEP-CTERM sorting domain-containing protein [Fibrobacteria bacterium]